MDVPQVIQGLLDRTGWSQERLADRLGTSQANISRWLAGAQQPGGRNMERLRELAVEKGVLEEPSRRRLMVPIMGRAGAGGEIDVAFEQAPPEGFEQVELSPTAMLAAGAVPDPIGFRVLGDSMEPRYEDGDILIVDRHPAYPLNEMIGMRAVVRTDEPGGVSRRFVKRIAHGPKTGLYNLESIGQDLPPIIGVRIIWASPVRAIIPRLESRLNPIRRARQVGL